MNNKLKVAGNNILHFFTSRIVVLQNRDNATVFELQLLWFLAIFLLFSGIIIAVIIISLLLGCNISIVDTNKSFFDKSRYK